MENYSKPVLDIMFEDIKQQLDRIEKQTTKTNGSVTTLKQWKAYITGAVSVIVIIGLPILGYLALEVINVNAELQSHVKSVSKTQ